VFRRTIAKGWSEWLATLLQIIRARVLLLLAGLVSPAITLVVKPLRQDLIGLPRAWVFAGSIVWGAALVLSLAAAVVPRRGDVLPGAARASRVSLIASQRRGRGRGRSDLDHSFLTAFFCRRLNPSSAEKRRDNRLPVAPSSGKRRQA
jgi:hypothetical protein